MSTKSTATTTEIELRMMIAEGLTYTQMGKRTGINPFDIGRTCRVLGLKDAKRDNAPPVEKYLEYMRKGMSITQISREVGRSTTAISTALKRAGKPTSAIALLRAEAAKKAA